MYNKRKAGVTAIALTLTLAVALPIQTMAAPVITFGGFSAGADTILSKTPSLDIQPETETDLTIGTEMQPAEQTTAEDVSFTAGAGDFVTASIAVAP